MGLSVLFVSGPRRCGKSVVVRAMLDHVWAAAKPHYFRLVEAGGDKVAPKMPPEPPPGSGLASAKCIEYDEERIFEILPEALTAVHKRDPYGVVVIEADADPILRYAYPYDHRIFVMPVPSSMMEVFRNPHEAAQEFRKALDDTAAFASEMFGLLQETDTDDGEPTEDRCDLTGTQMRSFLYSPLGDELATRIQLQRPYHGLIESDVILVNDSGGSPGVESDECLLRIDRLLDRLSGGVGPRAEMFRCKFDNHKDRSRKKFLKTVKKMCVPGK